MGCDEPRVCSFRSGMSLKSKVHVSMSIVRVGRFCGGGSWDGTGRAGVVDGSHRGGTGQIFSRMVCRAGRWLSTVASKIRCAGEHVLVSTNRLCPFTQSSSFCVWPPSFSYAGDKAVTTAVMTVGVRNVKRHITLYRHNVI